MTPKFNKKKSIKLKVKIEKPEIHPHKISSTAFDFRFQQDNKKSSNKFNNGSSIKLFLMLPIDDYRRRVLFLPTQKRSFQFLNSIIRINVFGGGDRKGF